MASFLRCPDCGRLLGVYSEFFEACVELNKKYISEKYKEYDPEVLPLRDGVVLTNKDILDALELKLCCRMRMGTVCKPELIYK